MQEKGHAAPTFGGYAVNYRDEYQGGATEKSNPSSFDTFSSGRIFSNFDQPETSSAIANARVMNIEEAKFTETQLHVLNCAYGSLRDFEYNKIVELMAQLRLPFNSVVQWLHDRREKDSDFRVGTRGSDVKTTITGKNRTETSRGHSPFSRCSSRLPIVHESSSIAQSNRADRTVFTALQLDALNQYYSHTQYPTQVQKIGIGSLLGLSDRVVKIWFKNKRSAEQNKAQEANRKAISWNSYLGGSHLNPMTLQGQSNHLQLPSTNDYLTSLSPYSLYNNSLNMEGYQPFQPALAAAPPVATASARSPSATPSATQSDTQSDTQSATQSATQSELQQPFQPFQQPFQPFQPPFQPFQPFQSFQSFQPFQPFQPFYNFHNK